MAEAPLIAGRIHGVRRWTLGWKGGNADLRGFGNARWRANGEPTDARCRLGRRVRPRHRVPGPDCSCGLYALHPWSAPELYGSGEPPEEAFGIVEAWGRVEVHANGFRAQFARPVALAVVGVPLDSDVGEAVARLARRYRAEAIAIADAAELAEHCRERGWGLSREVVRSLLAEVVEPDPDPADGGGYAGAGPPTATGSTARPPGAASRWARIGEALVMGVAALFWIAWYGFLAYVAVMIAILVFDGDPGSSGERFTHRRLRVIDEALVQRWGDLRYIAVIRNTSEKRVALAAFARGEVLAHDGDVVARLGRQRKAKGRPTLLPGETGVIIDVLRASRPVPERLRFKGTVVARRADSNGAKPPLELGEPALDRERCRLSVPVEAGHAAGGAEITIVATDAAGEISAAGSVALEREAVERGRQIIPLTKGGGCPGWLQGIETYPLLEPGHAKGGR